MRIRALLTGLAVTLSLIGVCGAQTIEDLEKLTPEERRAYWDSLSPEERDAQRQALRQALLDYCKLDTLALVRLARFLAATPAVG